MLPFLKLKVKIHKLSKDELDRREIDKLKFRPVIDSSRTPFHFYSKALMDYSSELTRKLCNKFFSGRSPLVKNGHQVAQFLASLNGERNNGTFMAIADLASAYTFIYVENLKFLSLHQGLLRFLGFTCIQLSFPLSLQWRSVDAAGT